MLSFFLFWRATGQLFAQTREPTWAWGRRPDWAPEYARVVAVTSGDQFTVRTPKGLRLRLKLGEVVAPQPDQRFGQEARRALARLILGKVLQLCVCERGRNGPAAASAWGRVGLSEEMARLGLVWEAREKGEMSVREAVDQARAAKRGLWIDPNPVPK